MNENTYTLMEQARRQGQIEFRDRVVALLRELPKHIPDGKYAEYAPTVVACMVIE